MQVRGGTLDGIDVLCDSRAEAVALDGVAFVNRTGNILDVRNTSNAALFEISSRNGLTTGLSSWVAVDGTSIFTTTPPVAYPPAVPASNGEDAVAPAPPTGLTVVARDSEVWLDWNRSPEPSIRSYKVYRATVAGGPYTAVATDRVVSAHQDLGLSNGTPLYYVVTALDNSGNESSFSQVSPVTPAVPVGIPYATWADGYALAEGPEGDDDKDNVQNLIEFTLGGDPKDPGDTGFPITTGMNENVGIKWFTFTYPKRSSPNSGVLYTPQISTTLAPGSWTTTGIESVGTVPDFHGPGFDAVTVRIAMNGKLRLFIPNRSPFVTANPVS